MSMSRSHRNAQAFIRSQYSGSGSGGSDVFPSSSSRYTHSMDSIQSFVQKTFDDEMPRPSQLQIFQQRHQGSGTLSTSTIGTNFSGKSSSLDRTETDFRGPQSRLGKNKRKSYLRRMVPEEDRQNLYAGVAHGDYDLQTTRPPLMYQMHLIEWIWLQTTVRHRMSLMILAVLISIFLVNATVAISFIIEGRKLSTPHMCSTPQCMNLVKRLKRYMNTSVDPCDNFYGFVCGSSEVNTTLSQEEEDGWNFGFRSGRITFDFGGSHSLGSMLKKTDKFPDKLILDLYRGCLHTTKCFGKCPESRQEKGLRPLYDLLKELHMYNISKTSQLSGDDVIDRMARVLSYSLNRGSLVLVNYYKNETSGQIHGYFMRGDGLGSNGGIFRYGYGTFFNVVRNSLLHLKELKVPEGDVDMLAHDITCIELFFRGAYISTNPILELISNDENLKGKICEIGPGFGGSPAANFGHSGSGEFNFDLLARKVYEYGNLGRTIQQSDIPNYRTEEQELRTNDPKFIEEFQKFFRASAPIRILRYMQWRLAYGFSLELNDEIRNLIVIVKRHIYLGPIQDCIHVLFSWLPFVTADRFIRQSSADAIANTKFHSDKFHGLGALVKQTYFDLIGSTKFKNVRKNVSNALHKYNVSEDEVISVIHSFLDDVIYKFREVSPANYTTKNFPDISKLYANIEFDEFAHMKNLLKIGSRMHQWRTNKHYTSTFFGIDNKYHEAIWLDRLTVKRHPYFTVGHLLYLPLASLEAPFFNDGLVVSDASGVGLLIADNYQYALLSQFHSVMGESVNLGDGDWWHGRSNRERYNLIMQHFWINITREYVKEVYKIEFMGKRWGADAPLYPGGLNQIVSHAIQDQSTYHVLSLMVNKYLKQPKNRIDALRVLRGLENYHAKELFYMTLVNRYCEVLGQKKFKHFLRFGPLPQQVRHNFALSHLDDFSDTFHCPPGSPMRQSQDKFSFWDRDVDINGDIDGS